MRSDLLANTFYGPDAANLSNKAIALRWLKAMFGGELSDKVFDRIYESVCNFFLRDNSGSFGGPISAGDGLFIAAFMEKVRPTHMIEIGVASGLSSAFIIEYAQKIGLLQDRVFLTSFDLVDVTPSGLVTGNLLKKSYPQYEQYWKLNCGVSSEQLISQHLTYLNFDFNDRVLAFIDANHGHPWPLMDLAFLRKAIPSDFWVILQDYQLMERWLSDAILFDAPVYCVARGVSLAVSLWSGSKIIGHDLSYNCAALFVDKSDDKFREYVKQVLRYPNEDNVDFSNLIMESCGQHL